MRTRAAFVVGVALGVWGVCGCHPFPPPVGEPRTIGIGCDEFRQHPHFEESLSLRVGEKITLAFCANATTGFSWEEPVIVDPSVLEVVSQGFEPPKGTAAGAPGTQSTTLRALHAGQTQVTFSYSRPWSGGEKGVWTYVATVTVR